ncbi:MAG TPA: phenylacetate--CoA ligase, partial [Casimicrobiaceae bacterium]|nr:phenylacetate--CoA ligase [Casimicrobiaceae bacterium]
RDLTRLLPPTARAMRRIEKITGRSDDMLIIRGVNLFPTQVEELIVKESALAPHYLIEVTRPAALDQVLVHCECAADASAEEGDAAGRRLGALIKSLIGISAGVNVGAPGSLERSMGKARRVVDRRPKT